MSGLQFTIPGISVGNITIPHASRATAVPVTGSLFTISGGRVMVTELVGTVTTVIQTQADATKLVFNPTATGASVDLCATLDITADAVNTFYGISGTLADAMTEGLNEKVAQAGGVLLSPGAIELACAATNTGSIKWDVWYVPLDAQARIEAA